MGETNQQVAATFWGVRGSTPCANRENMEFGGNTTCVQIHIPGSDEILILDSGTGIRNLGNKLVGESSQIHGRIFITHPHWDHIQGFPFFKPIYGPKNQFSIHMPRQMNGGCKDILSGHLTKTFFPVTLQMIDANIEYITQPMGRVEYEDYEVEFMLANHPINTAVYKIHLAGKEIVFCPDNELAPGSVESTEHFYIELKKFFQGVDVLIHDGQYDRETYKKRRGWGHSAWEEVVQFAADANVKNLFIMHHDPDSDDGTLIALDEYLKHEYRDRFDSIKLAKEGEKVVF